MVEELKRLVAEWRSNRLTEADARTRILAMPLESELALELGKDRPSILYVSAVDLEALFLGTALDDGGIVRE